MQASENMNPQSLARLVGLSLLASVGIGIVAAMFVVQGIDINLSADIIATAENMLEAEQRLRAKAYIGLLSFALSVLIFAGLFYLLRGSGPLLAGWSLLTGIGAAVLTLLGSMFAMNAAHLAGNAAYTTLTDEGGRLLLAGLQASSDYTSFHLALVLSSAAMAGFFWLFWRSGQIPRLIAGFGVFASLFVATTIVARDFIPALGANAVTLSFMLCNLVAILSLGLYLAIRGVRSR